MPGRYSSSEIMFLPAQVCPAIELRVMSPYTYTLCNIKPPEAADRFRGFRFVRPMLRLSYAELDHVGTLLLVKRHTGGVDEDISFIEVACLEQHLFDVRNGGIG